MSDAPHQELDKQMAALRAHQASAWVSTLAHASPAQREAFLDWLKESPAHVHEFLLAWAVDESLDQLADRRYRDLDLPSLLQSAQVVPLPASQRSAIGQQLPTSQPFSAQRPAPSVIRAHRLLYAAAAAMAMFVLAAGWLSFDRLAGWQTLRTGVGEQKSVQLKDGTLIQLNANSRVALHLADRERDVKLLDGEALFDVRHDARRPFRVITRDAVISDLGTRFDVYSRADSVKVAVIEGSVVVNTVAQRAGVLRESEEVQVKRDGSIEVGKLGNAAEALAWQQRRLAYRKETLQHIVEDFNRFNGPRFQLRDEELAQRQYTGVFDAGDPDALAQVLAQDPELLIERAGETIIVRRR